MFRILPRTPFLRRGLVPAWQLLHGWEVVPDVRLGLYAPAIHVGPRSGGAQSRSVGWGGVDQLGVCPADTRGLPSVLDYDELLSSSRRSS